MLRFLAKNVATKQSVSTMFSQVEKKADEARKAAKEAQTTADKALSKRYSQPEFILDEKEEVKVSSLEEDEHLCGQECWDFQVPSEKLFWCAVVSIDLYPW